METSTDNRRLRGWDSLERSVSRKERKAHREEERKQKNLGKKFAIVRRHKVARKIKGRFESVLPSPRDPLITSHQFRLKSKITLASN